MPFRELILSRKIRMALKLPSQHDVGMAVGFLSFTIIFHCVANEALYVRKCLI